MRLKVLAERKERRISSTIGMAEGRSKLSSRWRERDKANGNLPMGRDGGPEKVWLSAFSQRSFSLHSGFVREPDN